MDQRNRKRLCTLLAVLSLSACHPDAYPPPAQVVLPSGPEPAVAMENGAREFIAMSDPDANTHIASDVFPAEDNPEWRFTGLHPKFRFALQDVSHLLFYIRFFNHAQALRARGPVAFTVDINGQQFRSQRFAFEGEVEFRHALPEGFIPKPGPVEVSLHIDPPWLFPGGRTYGIFLHSIGFEQAGK